jgi:hypothetical protein
MSDSLLPGGPEPLPPEPEGTTYVDPTLGEQSAAWRWEARAAQWRARELAESVFGGQVNARLSGRAGRQPFRGLLHLEVPFSDLATHRALEAVFLSCASQDAVLGRIPLVFVLGPRLG